MNPCAMKVQQNSHKRHAPSHHLKSENSKNFDDIIFSFTAAVQTMWPYVTLPVHSRADVTTVTRYMRQSVSCDVLGKSEHRFPCLKVAAQELGMTATSAQSEIVYSHAVELYSEKRTNLGVRIFIISCLREWIHIWALMNWTWSRVAVICSAIWSELKFQDSAPSN